MRRQQDPSPTASCRSQYACVDHDRRARPSWVALAWIHPSRDGCLRAHAACALPCALPAGPHLHPHAPRRPHHHARLPRRRPGLLRLPPLERHRSEAGEGVPSPRPRAPPTPDDPARLLSAQPPSTPPTSQFEASYESEVRVLSSVVERGFLAKKRSAQATATAYSFPPGGRATHHDFSARSRAGLRSLFRPPRTPTASTLPGLPPEPPFLGPWAPAPNRKLTRLLPPPPAPRICPQEFALYQLPLGNGRGLSVSPVIYSDQRAVRRFSAAPKCVAPLVPHPGYSRALFSNEISRPGPRLRSLHSLAHRRMRLSSATTGKRWSARGSRTYRPAPSGC